MPEFLTGFFVVPPSAIIIQFASQDRSTTLVYRIEFPTGDAWFLRNFNHQYRYEAGRYVPANSFTPELPDDINESLARNYHKVYSDFIHNLN